MKRKMFGILSACVLVLSLSGFAVPAFADSGQPPYPEDPAPDEPYWRYTGDPYTRNPTELITKEYFGNEWVSTIPDDPGVTSPWEHHGYIAGSPLQLTPYEGPEGTYDYFATLAEESPRVVMWDIGKTELGHDMYIVAISSADTIARLDKYHENLLKLADPRKLGYPEDEAAANAEAEKLISNARELKPIFWVWAKLHSSETGSSEMAMELGYRLAVDKRPMFDEIRDNEIVFITDPNPDGTEMTANWVNYYLDLYGDIDEGFNSGWEPRAPFYNVYTQHDNNRDTHTNADAAQRNMVIAYNEWPAQSILDIHESMFLTFTFSGMEPTFPSIDPITQTEWQWFAARELNQMGQFDHPGVWMYRYVNMYYPFYQLQVANLRNGFGKFYEIYGHGYPTTVTRSVSGYWRTWYWYNPSPYKYDDIVWSFRNNVHYSQTCALTTALEMARNREIILENFWVKSKRSISLPGTTQIGCSGYFTYPYAYVVPSVQKDMPDTVRMINNLIENGVEVATADSPFSIGGEDYPEGSFILSLAQPTSRLLYALFDVQHWPEGVAAPYDATAWQYDLMRDVVVDRIDDPDIYDVPMTQITAEQIEYPYTVGDEISEGFYVVDHNSINNVITLVFGLRDYEVYAAEQSDDGVIDVGDVIVPAEQEGVYEAVVDLVGELGLTMHSVAETAVDMHLLNVPKVGLYHAWRCIQDGGWSRYTFEQFLEPGVDYDVIQRTDVLAHQDDLKDYYDVIFLPDTRGRNLYRGDSPGSVPEEVWYGPVQTTQRTGGLGDDGVAALKKFVDDGGVLICNNAATDFPIDYDFIEDVTDIRAWNAPGPIVTILPDPDNPIAYGADEEECVYQNQSPAFEAPEEWVVASYPEDPDDIMLSGLLEGADEMAGLAAIVNAPAADGDGRVVLFGTDITYRWQAHGAYFYLWNTIMNWDDLP